MKRVALVCPGRGSYARAELGSLSASRRPEIGKQREALVAAADRYRKRVGRIPVSELDQRPRFGSEHLAGENAAALIYCGTAIDALSLRSDLEVVAVGGNSMGWYSALHVSGCFDFESGLHLADTMGSLQKDGIVGGQVIQPVVDADWQRLPNLVLAVDAALAEVRAAGFQAWRSIRLGGFEVLAGDQEAIRILLQRLPAIRMGEKDYPFQLMGHSAFHTPLMETTHRKATELLSNLPWRAPRIPLVDGRGRVFAPKTAFEGDLREYTLKEQVLKTYDFTRSLRVILREYAPDFLVLLGPGDSLGGAIGQVMVEERWAGIRSKRDFLERQNSESPILVSMARAEQAARVI